MLVRRSRFPIAAICRQGVSGASTVRSGGRWRLASEIISNPRSTARCMPQWAANASNSVSATTPSIPIIASRISVRRSRMVRAMSEYPERFRFDSRTKHGMEACPRHHVGLRAEDVVNALLHVHQFDQAEARVVGVEKQIHIAVRPGFLTGHRSEQIKAGYAEAMQFGLMGTERRDYLLSIHGNLLKSCPPT